jgi:hypothetical protein
METSQQVAKNHKLCGGRNRFNLCRESLSKPWLAILVREIRSALSGCKTLLDVGCGSDSPMRFLDRGHLVGLEGYAPVMDKARRNCTHDELILGDVKLLADLFPVRRFDACVALDVIEHLQKDDGWHMLENLERLATRKVVILTPNGFLPQMSKEGDLQEHLSGWTADEFRGRGYRVLGMNGPKSMRGEYHRMKYRPRAFWSLVSILAHHLYTRAHPEKAAAILCVKDLSGAQL